MKRRFLHRSLVLVVAAALGLVVGGCGRDNQQGQGGQVTDANSEQAAAKKKDDHSQWWCTEHGIPEKECSMCQTKVAEECKKKGDWCEKHDRAKSQCFICDPSLKEKFAAKYRAKYGKEPPPIDELEEKKQEEKPNKEEKK